MDLLQFWASMMPDLLEGLKITLQLTVLCLLFGSVIGVLLAVGRVYGNTIIYAICTAFIEFIRGTPLLVQMFVLYYGLPEVGILLSPFISATIALSLNTSAYQAEYFRGAIQSIKSSQMAAARAIGMTKNQAIFNVILPQSIRLFIPPWTNEVILMLQATSVAFVITVPELMSRGQEIATRTFRYLDAFILVAIFYLLTVFVFSYILRIFENKFSIPGLEMK